MRMRVHFTSPNGMNAMMSHARSSTPTMAQNSSPAYPPSVADFYQHLNRSIFRSLGDSVPALAQQYGDTYLADFEFHLQLLRAAFPEKPWPKWVADGYVGLNKAILREEQGFRETGRYSAGIEDLDQVKQDVYDNANVMEKFYLVGLYCTYFLWHHHYRILNFFRNEFLLAPGNTPRTSAEWGVGHGLLTFEALKTWPEASTVLADISCHSLGFSQALLTSAGMWPRCSTVFGDVLATPQPVVDRLICSELLEHVPDPRALLIRVCESLSDRGIAYITGAINAPQPDHVFLFNSSEELLGLVESCGLRVRSHLSVCHPNREGDEKPPTVLALVAGRA
jgi:Methyltransferase domain